MVVALDSVLEAALKAAAERQGVAPDEVARALLRDRLLPQPEPRDDWERELLAASRPWGISLPNSAVSSEGLYD